MGTKTGFLAICALVGIIVLAAVMLAATPDPVDVAVVQAQLNLATAPAQAEPIGGIWSLAIKGLVVLGGLIILGALASFAYGKMVNTNTRWTGGPNANFGRVPRNKPLTLKEMVEMQFYRQFIPPQRQPDPNDTGNRPDYRRKAEF